MAKVRKSVIKVTITGMIVVDLKDSQSVLSASKTIEGITMDLKNSDFIGVQVKEAFGNADIEATPAKDKE